MTTIPLPQSQRSKLQAISGSAAARVLVGLALFMVVSGQAIAETYDAGEQLYRRGYPNDVDLEWAAADYNSAHRSDSVAKEYPELNIAEILPAIAHAITETPRKNKKELAKLAWFKKLVMNGRLPKGGMITFQYFGKKYRTPYTTQWGKLSDKFAIVLFSGMDENPPGESQWNEKAFILGVVIRFHKRVDQAWVEEGKRIAGKMKRKKEH
jgi:hypothetical protein